MTIIIVKLKQARKMKKYKQTKSTFNHHNRAHFKVTIILKSQSCKGWNDTHETKKSTV